MQDIIHSEWLQNLLRRHWGKLLTAQVLIVFAVGYYVATLVGGSAPSDSTPSDPHADHIEAAATLWTCSMHPQIRQSKPGKCPLCGMKLVPVTKTAGGGMRTINISPAARELMKIQTSPVERRYVAAEVRMVGKVEYDETKLSHITAWVSGRLDRLFVDYTGVQVKPGDHMVYIYSEELYAVQDELIRALEFQRQRGPSRSPARTEINLVESAREKLRLLGLTDSQIKEIEQRDKPTDHITIQSPIGGIVIEKLKQEGDRVRTGDRIYTVADLNQVWIKLDAYESDLVWLRYGQEVTFSTEAYPGEEFTGRIAFIDPVLDKQTRTVKVRVNVPNSDGKLKPEMFVRATVKSDVAAGGRVLSADLAGKWISPMHPEIVSDKPGNCTVCGMPLVRSETLGYVAAQTDENSRPLVIPASAALVTGTRAIVYVEQPTAEEPTFDGREIVLGPRAGDFYLVKHGLNEGELVVTNGNFKLDSALQIQAKPTMMTPEGGGGGGHDHGGHGAGDEKRSEMADAAMTLTAEFRSKLNHLVAAFDELAVVVKASRLDDIRSSFRQFGETIQQNGNDLSGHASVLWDEYSMLLSNDAVEGSEVGGLADADRVFLLTKRHVQRMREQFGIVHEGHEQHEMTMLPTPPEFQRQLATLWHAYLPVQQALAGDNLQNATERLPSLTRASQQIDASLLDSNAGDAWKMEAANLSEIFGGLQEAKDISEFRSAFALLSDEMAVIAKSFGFGPELSVYKLHCPMAFKGRGAIWLQADDATKNPYFGATMLKCADRVDLISKPMAKLDEDLSAHGGHQHEQ
jgi:Cu(I)/Ag(I) efflux system membrane fusion protein